MQSDVCLPCLPAASCGSARIACRGRGTAPPCLASQGLATAIKTSPGAWRKLIPACCEGFSTAAKLSAA
ncbi:uncharacterized protein SETTUDRAFT_164585 [Exserohilum turcica Et28A]|uniref:Uncharacterized protein n=1 Tax=Exserohilum turcicum (strain 28A) TaxID=671987 RepID=R0IDB1_EXST2|nr:uncharacterized protein SETTUDRAFT_164585 [Exserohilum turcica Et28A]EOA83121.1 hypothetical protein SETTUDRAFT_164585 [Exserohilum turcica Et28A]